MSRTSRPGARTSRARTIDTACPLDCPDSCSLTVIVEGGRVVTIDGSERQPVTKGYICAKVRGFGDRLYGQARLRTPGVRKGAKGAGSFRRVNWDEALDLVADRMRETRDRWGGEAILPVSYGGSNGLISQDTTDAQLFRGLGASRLARTVCAAPTKRVAAALYGKMAGVAYPDYVDAELIVIWGANPSTSGIHLVPYLYDAQRRGARLVVIDPISTPLARRADLHLAVRPGTDVAVALALHRHLFETGAADADFLESHTRGAERLRARAADWTFERAAEVAGVDAEAIARLAGLYQASSPAVIRCGWGLERNRNGGNAALAVLSLPAVAGKFGVRGGGFTMSNSGAWDLDAGSWIGVDEPATRVVNMNQLGQALTTLDDPPVKVLFVYNCNPAVTMPDQNAVLRGLAREDLFTVVFEQVQSDTADFADVVLPATTFLEAYDVARGYGALSLQVVQPVVEALDEARPNVEVFADLAGRLDLGDGRFGTDAEALLQVLERTAPETRQALLDHGVAAPAFGSTPVQFVDVFPRTPDQKVDLFPEDLEASAPAGLYRYRDDPANEQHPLTLISPASGRTISSTLGELHSRPAFLQMHQDDATGRGVEDGDTVRVFNDLGEVHCFVKVTNEIRPGTVSLPKGLWRRSTLNGSTANALAPSTLTDLGDGACFNDARVEVVRVLSADFKEQAIAFSVSSDVGPSVS